MARSMQNGVVSVSPKHGYAMSAPGYALALVPRDRVDYSMSKGGLKSWAVIFVFIVLCASLYSVFSIRELVDLAVDMDDDFDDSEEEEMIHSHREEKDRDELETPSRSQSDRLVSGHDRSQKRGRHREDLQAEASVEDEDDGDELVREVEEEEESDDQPVLKGKRKLKRRSVERKEEEVKEEEIGSEEEEGQEEIKDEEEGEQKEILLKSPKKKRPSKRRQFGDDDLEPNPEEDALLEALAEKARSKRQQKLVHEEDEKLAPVLHRIKPKIRKEADEEESEEEKPKKLIKTTKKRVSEEIEEIKKPKARISVPIIEEPPLVKVKRAKGYVDLHSHWSDKESEDEEDQEEEEEDMKEWVPSVTPKEQPRGKSKLSVPVFKEHDPVKTIKTKGSAQLHEKVLVEEKDEEDEKEKEEFVPQKKPILIKQQLRGTSKVSVPHLKEPEPIKSVRTRGSAQLHEKVSVEEQDGEDEKEKEEFVPQKKPILIKQQPRGTSKVSVPDLKEPEPIKSVRTKGSVQLHKPKSHQEIQSETEKEEEAEEEKEYVKETKFMHQKELKVIKRGTSRISVPLLKDHGPVKSTRTKGSTQLHVPKSYKELYLKEQDPDQEDDFADLLQKTAREQKKGKSKISVPILKEVEPVKVIKSKGSAEIHVSKVQKQPKSEDTELEVEELTKIKQPPKEQKRGTSKISVPVIKGHEPVKIIRSKGTIELPAPKLFERGKAIEEEEEFDDELEDEKDRQKTKVKDIKTFTKRVIKVSTDKPDVHVVKKKGSLPKHSEYTKTEHFTKTRTPEQKDKSSEALQKSTIPPVKVFRTKGTGTILASSISDKKDVCKAGNQECELFKKPILKEKEAEPSVRVFKRKGQDPSAPNAKGFDTSGSHSMYLKHEITNKEDNKIRDRWDQGDKLLDEGKLHDALAFFDKLLASHSKSPRGNFGKAKAFELLAEQQKSNKLLEQAIRAFETVMDLPDVPDELFKRAGAKVVERARFRGWVNQAYKAQRRLVDRYPEDMGILNQMGINFLIMGRHEDAKRTFRDVLKRDPENGLAQVHYGFILKTADDQLEEGAKYMKMGVDSAAVGTKDGRFFFHLGDAYQRLGRQEEAADIYRQGAAHGLFLSKDQRSLYNVEGLVGRPWWTVEQTGHGHQFRTIERQWKIIRDEGLALLDRHTGVFQSEDEKLTDKGDWKQFTLYARGRRHASHCGKVPKTCEILEQFKAATTCSRGQIKFSVMHGGTKVHPHCGPTNCRLRSHLGLVIPAEPRIRVGNETRSWKQGKFIIFDDSFEHEVWYEGKGMRMILIVDFWHPQLTENQRATLVPI